MNTEQKLQSILEKLEISNISNQTKQILVTILDNQETTIMEKATNICFILGIEAKANRTKIIKFLEITK